MHQGFQSRPASARPELFWDWMHDLVSKEGLTHNLEAMKRNGFSGAIQAFTIRRVALTPEQVKQLAEQTKPF